MEAEGQRDSMRQRQARSHLQPAQEGGSSTCTLPRGLSSHSWDLGPP